MPVLPPVDLFTLFYNFLRQRSTLTMSQQPPLDPAPDPFKKLPPEVFRLIVSQFCGHCCGEYKQPFGVDNSVQATTDLYKFCFVSRRFRDACQPVLFHYFGIEYIGYRSRSKNVRYRLLPFLRTIASRPDLGRTVKVVSLEWEVLNDLNYFGGHAIFEKCANSLGTSGAAILEKSRNGQDPSTDAIRESFLLGRSTPEGTKFGECLPVMAGELLAMMFAILPNLTYLGVTSGGGSIRTSDIQNGGDWRLDVSLLTLGALGITTLGLKTLKSYHAIPQLLSRATSLETLISGGHVNGYVPDIPSLKCLHLLSGWGRHGPTARYLPQCTGQLTTFSYTSAEPHILTFVEYLDQPKFHESLESVHLDFQVRSSDAKEPMPSLKSFTKLKTLLLAARPIYGCDSTSFEHQSLLDILPPNIESLTLVGENLPASPNHRLYQDMLRLLEQKSKMFPRLRRITSDSSHFSGPILRGAFEQAGVALIHQELLRISKRYTAEIGFRDEADFRGWLEEYYRDTGIDACCQIFPDEMSPDPDL